MNMGKRSGPPYWEKVNKFSLKRVKAILGRCEEEDIAYMIPSLYLHIPAGRNSEMK